MNNHDAASKATSPDLENPTQSGGWLHWGGIVAFLYLLALLVITIPVVMASFPSEAAKNGIPWEIYKEPVYLGLIGVICLSQFLLLRVPIRLKFQRPVSRAAVWLPILVAAFWMGCLTFGLVLAVAEAVKYNGSNAWLIWGLPLLGWVIWAVIFARMSRASTPGEAVQQQSRWMLRGSILELLIAVPSHIVARGRADCCAGFMTFIGITMGVSVMLLSFGPAVFLLYHARYQRLKAKQLPA